MFAAIALTKAVIAALLILLALVLAAIAAAGYFDFWKGTIGPAKPADQATSNLNELRLLLERISAENREPTAEECAKMWNMHDRAVSGGISTITMNQVGGELMKICHR